MNRSVAALLVLSLIAVPATASAQPPSLYVSDVSVSPASPVPGERFTVAARIQNPPSSPSQAIVTAVTVLSGDGETEYVRVEDLGTVPPGGQIRVPATLSFDDPGARQLRFVVHARSQQDADERDRVRVNAPFVVNVREDGIHLDAGAGHAVVGAETAVTVAAVNGEDEPARNLRVSLEGRNATVDDPTRLAAALPGGGERAFNFSATPTARDAAVTATLRYTTAGGTDRTVRQTLHLSAEPLREDVRVDASVAGAGDAPPVAVAVSNFGNAPLSGAVVSASADGTTHARRSLGTVPADGERTVRLNLSGVSADTDSLDVTVDYETGGSRGTAATRLAYSSNPARIDLTSVSFEREGDHLLVSGSASNVGLSDASSAVVSVVSTDGVTPVGPNREYFVGTVPASDFVSFDLTVRVDDGVAEVPVRVSYVAGGVRQSTVHRVPIDDASTPQSRVGDDGGPSLLWLLWLLGGVAALAVVGAAAYAYVRR